MAEKKKILIIENSPTQAAVIAGLLEELSYVPVVYTEVDKGVAQILAIENPFAVLLDVKLLDRNGNRVADGFKICREIKRKYKGMPVIVMSSEGNEQASAWAQMQGADDFLKKPFSSDDLEDILERIIYKS